MPFLTDPPRTNYKPIPGQIDETFHGKPAVVPGVPLRKIPVLKSGYDALKVPTGTPLSRTVIKELHELKKPSTLYETREPSEKKPEDSVRVPAFPRGAKQHEKIAVIQEPLRVTERGPTSSLAVRKKKPTSYAFQRLGPGLTKSENFIPSTVLGNVADYSDVKQGGKRRVITPDLVDENCRDMRNVRSLFKDRQETVIKRPKSRERGKKCLEHFERKMQARQNLTRRLAGRLGRRVSELVLNSEEAVRHKRELQDLGEINQGPRPLYQIYVADKKASVDPELLFREPPYNAVTFTGKSGLMKLKTATAGFEVNRAKKIKVKQFLMLNTDMHEIHRECQVNKDAIQRPPAGLRNPEFNELIITGTNDPYKPIISPVEKNDRIEKLDFFSDGDLCEAFIDPPGKNPFAEIEEFPPVQEEPPVDPASFPVLDIKAMNCDEVSITRRENGLDILIKLHCALNGMPAATNLLLTNIGIEPLEFGMYPIKYPDPLWSDRRTGVIYFVGSTGILEGPQPHVLTAIFESHEEGNFAEAYRLWTLPHTTTPRDITLVVEGRSQPRVYLDFPSADFTPKFTDGSRFLPSAQEQLDAHVKEVLEKMASEKGPSSRIPLEEKFKLQNNLEYQSEGVTKLRYAWLFAHLKHSDIPWYDVLIERERQKKAELPGEINKRMLLDLAEVHLKLNHKETEKPEFVDFETPTDEDEVYWRNPAIVYKCPVHDQDLPLPGTTTHFAESVDANPHTTDEISSLPPIKKSDPAPSLPLSPVRNPAPSGSSAFITPPLRKLPTEADKIQLKPKRTKKGLEVDTDWIPMVVLQDGVTDTPLDQSRNPSPGKKIKRKKYVLNPKLNLPEKPRPGTSEADKDAIKAAMDEKWLKYTFDRDWITTAVTFVSETGEKADDLSANNRPVPEWSFSIEELRNAVQNSPHHIYVKLGLLREISRIEQAMAHLKPTLPLNYTTDEKTEELLSGSMAYVLKRAATYSVDLFSYFNRACENAKPEEPQPSADLIKARDRVKAIEDASSPTSKGKAKRAAKAAAAESHQEDAKSRASSKETDQQKSSVPVNRPSKSASVNLKTPLSTRDSKRVGVAGATHAEATRAEKNAKHQLAILEAEYETQLEMHKVKLAEHEKWKEERELELEPKIHGFVHALWEKELSNLDKNVHERVVKLQLEQDLEEEKVRKKYIDERRENTLRNLYDRLLQLYSEIPLSVAAWRARLTDNIVKSDDLVPDRIKESWELRRKEVKIYTKERPNDRIQLKIRNIWRAPYTYQLAAEQADLTPLRIRPGHAPPPEEMPPLPPPPPVSPVKEPISRGKSAIPRKASNSTKSTKAVLTFHDESPIPNPQEPTVAKPVHKPRMHKEEKVMNRVIDDFKECLAEIAGQDEVAVEEEPDSGDEWETDDEKVLDAWLYEPTGPEAIKQLPADFKFVSFKDAKTNLPGQEKADHVRKRIDEAVGKEEASSSSEEEYNWEPANRK